MLTLSNLKPKLKKRSRKRVGRGPSSGHGGYSGRGIKGQKARTGGSIPPGFEGGRMPLIRQMPKVKGFRSPRPRTQTVTLKDLRRVFPEGGLVSAKLLLQKGLIGNKNIAVKIVGKDKLDKSYTLHSLEASAHARTAIEAAGGKIVAKAPETEVAKS